jgi:hypothetical protein
MNHFDAIGVAAPGRSAFDLSQDRLFDCDIGQLVPVMAEEVLPGDVFEIANENMIRAQPMVAPLYHRLRAYTHYFFVPTRLIFEDWEKFITGGVDGDDTTSLPLAFENCITTEGQADLSRYGFWDYLGLPMHNTGTGAPTNTMSITVQPTVIDFPWRAYWTIWREYYRDPRIMDQYPDGATDVGQDDKDKITNLNTFMDAYDTVAGPAYEPYCDQLAYRCWSKDYFTSALSDQQAGTAGLIDISGVASAVWDGSQFITGSAPGTPDDITVSSNASTPGLYFAGGNQNANALEAFNDNTVPFTATGIDVADLRLAVQVQRWQERNMRAGYRYTEQLKARWGVAPRDERLQRPEYIGGTAQPIIISEILQTESSDASTPQGTLVGHGMSLGDGYVGRYRAKEHGIIMGVLSIMPEAIYQQGIDRMWSRQTRYDYYSPEFAHLSEQEILNQELFYSMNAVTDATTFAYQAAYDEYRTRRSVVCGKLASDLKYWHLSRIFDSVPSLNEEFLTTEALSLGRRTAWAVSGVEGGTQAEFLIQWKNIVKAVRPLPYIADPGLLDHI